MTDTGRETRAADRAGAATSPLAKYAEHWLLPDAEVRYADTKRILRKVLRREPKARGAIRTVELMRIAERLGLVPVELRHYCRGISINSAACFGVAPEPVAGPRADGLPQTRVI